MVNAFTEELAALQALHDAKNADYTGGGHPLANYRFSAEMIGVPTHVGMFARLAEKFYRIHSLIATGAAPRVTDEALTDTLRDIAIIAVMMKLCLSEPGFVDEWGNAFPQQPDRGDA